MKKWLYQELTQNNKRTNIIGVKIDDFVDVYWASESKRNSIELDQILNLLNNITVGEKKLKI